MPGLLVNLVGDLEQLFASFGPHATGKMGSAGVVQNAFAVGSSAATSTRHQQGFFAAAAAQNMTMVSEKRRCLKTAFSDMETNETGTTPVPPNPLDEPPAAMDLEAGPLDADGKDPDAPPEDADAAELESGV